MTRDCDLLPMRCSSPIVIVAAMAARDKDHGGHDPDQRDPL